MKPRARVELALVGFSAALALGVGCAHLPTYAIPRSGGSPSPGFTPSPNPSGSPNPSPTPANCATPYPTTAVFVAMTTTATATIDPTYGEVDGYTDQFDNSGAPSNIANVIVVPPNSVVQFVNLEPLGPQPSPGDTPSIIDHSAAALPTAFPAPSYSFPPAEKSALGTQVSSSPWSTGPVGQDFYGGTICYSQAFTVPSGTAAFPFGDLAYFSLTNMRDVIVVSTTANTRRHLRFFRRATPAP